MEKSIIDRIDKVLDRITHITSGIPAFAIGILLVVWVILILTYVIVRVGSEAKWLFVLEFTEYWMVYVVFFSIAYTLKSRRHINLDIVVIHFSKKANTILEAITLFLSLFLTCFLVERGIHWLLYAIESNVYSQGPMHVLMWPVFLVVPIGLTMLALELVLNLYRDVVQLVRGERAASENTEKVREA